MGPVVKGPTNEKRPGPLAHRQARRGPGPISSVLLRALRAVGPRTLCRAMMPATPLCWERRFCSLPLWHLAKLHRSPGFKWLTGGRVRRVR